MGESDRIKLYFSIFVFKKCGSYKKNRFPPSMCWISDLNTIPLNVEYKITGIICHILQN